MKRIIYLVVFSFLIGCIDEINLTTGGSEPKLVVDAWISNDPTLSYVKVYYSAPFQSGNNHLRFNQPTVNRIFVETDKDGTVYEYFAQWNSDPNRELITYIPRSIIDIQTGESYRLNILLQDGNHYRSEWQRVAPKGEILNFEYELFQKSVFRPGPVPSQFMQYFLDVQAIIENPSQDDFGYYIKARGIEELMTNARFDFCQCVCYLDVPNIFSGMNVINIAGLSGSTIKHSIGSLSMGRINRHYIDVDLYTTSPEAAAYLGNIQIQQNNTGSIFDPIPFKIKGNIKNLNNEAEEVLGFFFTAHHYKKDKIVNRAEIYSRNRHLDFYLDEIPLVDINCREFYTDAVNFPPPPFRR